MHSNMLFSEILAETSGPTAKQNKPATQAKPLARIIVASIPLKNTARSFICAAHSVDAAL
jgi:hypothetical protein